MSKNVDVYRDNKSINQEDKSRQKDGCHVDILGGHQLQAQEVLVDQGVLWALADLLQDLPLKQVTWLNENNNQTDHFQYLHTE